MDYGGWMIVDAFANSVVAGELDSPRALSLDQVEAHLTAEGEWQDWRAGQDGMQVEAARARAQGLAGEGQ